MISAKCEGNARIELPTHNVSALVAEYAWFVPMLAAAVIWTAHPQSMDATEATDPIVFASVREGSATRRLRH